ncbi:hypothetical protein KI387_040305, partial [Taxus chinensis]
RTHLVEFLARQRQQIITRSYKALASNQSSKEQIQGSVFRLLFSVLLHLEVKTTLLKS